MRELGSKGASDGMAADQTPNLSPSSSPSSLSPITAKTLFHEASSHYNPFDDSDLEGSTLAREAATEEQAGTEDLYAKCLDETVLFSSPSIEEEGSDAIMQRCVKLPLPKRAVVCAVINHAFQHKWPHKKVVKVLAKITPQVISDMWNSAENSSGSGLFPDQPPEPTAQGEEEEAAGEHSTDGWIVKPVSSSIDSDSIGGHLCERLKGDLSEDDENVIRS
ncbi:hypothetical protein GUITHDRAFT_118801 [Guillardia theta CCMP2712]|uniref:Uncharacterized protein n=1 Tax=Guillardia theta (strain CCMP2712) TaxID=905079 RepID=L1IGT8_GUITC|nr:hypothetical protein GUITHDRAFT_118801 [Guillardia theta CCMP2712]EKX35050.1 hypothetical protein GUITHDRAFT_118801 [Guillardia theta CCMP2712]|eukprot:XP_005822030.1 hypothetical protein GUITHDRAFT_118801 [Guillardia theta CCMP2712]